MYRFCMLKIIRCCWKKMKKYILLCIYLWIGWQHWLNGHEFEQALGVGDGQVSLQSMGSQRIRHDWATELNWTDAEAETPILWPPDAKSWLTGKDPDAGKDWGQEEKGATENEMVGWHHWLNGHELEQTQGESDGQRSLACCSSWGRKESDIT